MREGPSIASVAALIGDPTRATMLTALIGGRALTASELASTCGITAQTASSHLSKLVSGRLAAVRQQGRHRYYTLANSDVATTLEGLMGLAAGSRPERVRTGPKDASLRRARVCYNHLAGEMGTRLFDACVGHGHVERCGDELRLTPSGYGFLRELGIGIDALENRRSPLCRECLDWSERRSHLAGSVGRALLARFESMRWLRRIDGSRAVRFSANGERRFEALLRTGRLQD